MKDRIIKAIADKLPAGALDNLADIGDDAWGAVRQYAARPCYHYLHHQRQLERLAAKKRVPFRKVRMAHHRMWRRYWESRCMALNSCTMDKGC